MLLLMWALVCVAYQKAELPRFAVRWTRPRRDRALTKPS
jgi:hypothetical protein